MDFNHIALVGLGLIASSIALNIKSKKNRIKITGYSRTKKTREEARKINFCTVCDNYEDCIKEANLVILCVPVGAMGDTMEKITPYLSKSATEFWRRWHISLSTWFRDYLYVPLGGSKGGNLITLRKIKIQKKLFSLLDYHVQELHY